MKFYDNHHKYYKVGIVKNPPIDPNSPIPEDCTAEKKSEEGLNKANNANKGNKKP
jgi:hypothetical protein